MIGKYIIIRGRLGRVQSCEIIDDDINVNLVLAGASWSESGKVADCIIINDQDEFHGWINDFLEELVQLTDWISEGIQPEGKAICWLALADVLKAYSYTIRSELNEKGMSVNGH